MRHPIHLSLRLALYLALVLATIGPLTHILKVTHINYDVGAYVFYIAFPALIFFLGLGVFSRRSEIPLFSALATLMVCMLLFSGFVTFVVGGDPVDIAGNFLRVMFGILALTFFSNNAFDYVEIVNRLSRRLAQISLVITCFAAATLYVASNAGFGVYFGLQNTPAFFSLAYGFAMRKYGYVLLSIAAIVASGKRGAIGATAVICFIYAMVLFRRNEIKRLTLILSVLVAIGFLVIGGGFLPDSITARFAQFSSSGNDVDWNAATAGRFDELESVLQQLTAQPIGWLTGYGLGATISIDGVADSTVHFSPFGMMLIFGLPLTILFYLCFLWIIARGFVTATRLTGQGQRYYLIAYLTFVAEFVFSFSAFTVLQGYMLWMMLAYLTCVSKIIQLKGMR